MENMRDSPIWDKELSQALSDDSWCKPNTRALQLQKQHMQLLEENGMLSESSAIRVNLCFCSPVRSLSSLYHSMPCCTCWVIHRACICGPSFGRLSVACFCQGLLLMLSLPYTNCHCCHCHCCQGKTYTDQLPLLPQPQCHCCHCHRPIATATDQLPLLPLPQTKCHCCHGHSVTAATVTATDQLPPDYQTTIFSMNKMKFINNCIDNNIILGLYCFACLSTQPVDLLTQPTDQIQKRAQPLKLYSAIDRRIEAR